MNDEDILTEEEQALHARLAAVGIAAMRAQPTLAETGRRIAGAAGVRVATSTAS